MEEQVLEHQWILEEPLEGLGKRDGEPRLAFVRGDLFEALGNNLGQLYPKQDESYIYLEQSADFGPVRCVLIFGLFGGFRGLRRVFDLLQRLFEVEDIGIITLEDMGLPKRKSD